MKMYIVTREGVYRHEVLGLYVDIPAAKEAACKETDKENEDGYHRYLISEIEVGVDCEDAKALYYYQKSKEYDYSTRPYTVLRTYIEINQLKNGKWEVIDEVA